MLSTDPTDLEFGAIEERRRHPATAIGPAAAHRHHTEGTLLRRIITTATLVFAALAATLVVASPAAAAGSCNQTFGVTEVNWETKVWIPALSQSVAGTNCVMSVGSYGSAVRNLQIHLNECYGPNSSNIHVFYTLLTVDSSFGNKTRDALKAVQNWTNSTQGTSLTVDGVYGRNTRNAMRFWLGLDVCAPVYPI
jgi:hypothetical protein